MQRFRAGRAEAARRPEVSRSVAQGRPGPLSRFRERRTAGVPQCGWRERRLREAPMLTALPERLPPGKPLDKTRRHIVR